MPVAMSHVLTTPFESLEIAIPSFVHRVMDLIGAEARGINFGSVTGSIGRAPICQNLIGQLWDDETREEGEENAKE